MAQTIQILRTTTNTPPPTLLPGALSAELGTQTKLWIGAAAGNRLLLSTDPTDITLSGGAIIASAAPNAMPGSLWWDSNIGQLYIRYFDGNSTAWVSASTGTSVAIPIAVASGGTGAITAPAALTNLGAVAKAGDTMTGNLTVGTTSGPDNPITLISAAGAQCRAIYQGARIWSAGVAATAGTWAISDETAPAVRIAISTAGACTNTTGTWAAISDASLKIAESITPYDRGLEAILALAPVNFTYNGKGGLTGEHFGLIANDVEGVVPEIIGEVDLAVGLDSESLMVKTVDPGRLIYALINSIKELNAKVEALAPAAPVARR